MLEGGEDVGQPDVEDVLVDLLVEEGPVHVRDEGVEVEGLLGGGRGLCRGPWRRLRCSPPRQDLLRVVQLQVRLQVARQSEPLRAELAPVRLVSCNQDHLFLNIYHFNLFTT